MLKPPQCQKVTVCQRVSQLVSKWPRKKCTHTKTHTHILFRFYISRYWFLKCKLKRVVTSRRHLGDTLNLDFKVMNKHVGVTWKTNVLFLRIRLSLNRKGAIIYAEPVLCYRHVAPLLSHWNWLGTVTLTTHTASGSGKVGLAPKWVRLATNGTNPGLFQISRGAKCTEFWSEKAPVLSHLGPIWTTLEPNLPSLSVWHVGDNLLFPLKQIVELTLSNCMMGVKDSCTVF